VKSIINIVLAGGFLQIVSPSFGAISKGTLLYISSQVMLMERWMLLSALGWKSISTSCLFAEQTA